MSKKYQETVCIGGITKEGNWIRLFPVRFRQLPYDKRFSKFDIIEAEVEPHNDKFLRKESHKIINTSIKVIGSIPASDWDKRKEMLLPKLSKSLEELEKNKKPKKETMGIIKPKEIVDFYKKDIDKLRPWEKELIEGTQKTLGFFTGGTSYQTPLEKIPYWMGYEFRCDDPECKGHNMMCEDWEMLQLFRAMKQKYGDDETAFEKVRWKFLEWMDERDPYFIVGTESRWNKFLIISVFYPPK